MVLIINSPAVVPVLLYSCCNCCIWKDRRWPGRWSQASLLPNNTSAVNKKERWTVPALPDTTSLWSSLYRSVGRKGNRSKGGSKPVRNRWKFRYRSYPAAGFPQTGLLDNDRSQGLLSGVYQVLFCEEILFTVNYRSWIQAVMVFLKNTLLSCLELWF